VVGVVSYLQSREFAWFCGQWWHLPFHAVFAVISMLFISPWAVIFMAFVIELDQWVVLPRKHIGWGWKLLDAFVDWVSWSIIPAIIIWWVYFW
jgi:hypothetical protein